MTGDQYHPQLDLFSDVTLAIDAGDRRNRPVKERDLKKRENILFS